MRTIFLTGVLLITLLGSVETALAQTQSSTFCREGKCTYTPLEPLPGVPQSGRADLPTLLAGLFKLLITFGSLFAVVMLTIAGIGYMVSESPVDIDKAKKRATAALWGLLLLTMCWLILYTINPKLLQFDILTSLKVLAPESGTERGGVRVNRTGESAQQSAREILNRCPGGLRYERVGEPPVCVR